MERSGSRQQHQQRRQQQWRQWQWPQVLQCKHQLPVAAAVQTAAAQADPQEQQLQRCSNQSNIVVR